MVRTLGKNGLNLSSQEMVHVCVCVFIYIHVCVHAFVVYICVNVHVLVCPQYCETITMQQVTSVPPEGIAASRLRI